MKFATAVCLLLAVSESLSAKLSPCAPSYDCVPAFLCKNGTIVTDGTGLIDLRVKPIECINPEYPDVQGYCCRIPGATDPPPLAHCPAGRECVLPQQCNPDGTINTDGTGILDLRIILEHCYYSDTEVGVCCIPPVPIVELCPGPSICASECNGRAYDHLNQLIPYTPDNTLWTQCNLGGGHLGVCCQPVIPSYDTCPDNSICVPGSQCNGDAYDYTSTWAPYNVDYQLWSTCDLKTLGGASGVCCKPLPIETCPGDSFCLIKELCTGDALDHSNQFSFYDPASGPWPTCPLQGDLGLEGVCCLFPAPKKYPVAAHCGARNEKITEIDTRIISPIDEATFGEFPWQAIIFYSNYTFKCGATLIEDKWLLTAAHCVQGIRPVDLRIRLGEWQVNGIDEPLAYEDYDVKNHYIHPLYTPGPYYNDVAVIELIIPVVYKYHINRACLASGGLGHYEPYVGRYCWTSGWGKDAFNGDFQHIIKKVDLPVVGHTECQSLLRKTRLGRFFGLHDSFLCAGGEENKDACRGDGGGPLVCEEKDGTYTLVGITAWGIGCGTKDVPGVYASVGHAHEFISGVLTGQIPPPTYD